MNVYYVIDPAHSGGPAAFATSEEAEEYANKWDGEIIDASQVDPAERAYHEDRLAGAAS